ncbi:hypothetical protein [Nocardia sp. XZ_19_385]|uniref:hypothetical protein n=1 Tax=Nocardia sp. XZ_19_385 TaxID=2769488 RepID=UPI00188F7BCC|nr:hypothetical protein [Nocardia sp. XZ_19_385]
MTGDTVLDGICTGATIRTAQDALVAEAESLYELGCRYYHYHARNPLTREQTTDNALYEEVSRGIQRGMDGLMISFGASRNGGEVRDRIRRYGEWERVSQCALPLHLGGAHFVTIQAAVELQIITDMERQFGELDLDLVSSPRFLELMAAHEPSSNLQDARLDTYSTTNGAVYGKTSPMIQFEVYSNAIAARRRLNLFHEVEWVQLMRSYAMTRYAIEHPAMRLGSSGQLNITLLFGFSPRLPFPESYAEFQRVVDLAKSLEYDLGEPGAKRRNVTISVGAAVIPQQASEHFRPLDVGPRRGENACALRRLVTYAAQPGSRVDLVRVGMEDTPYAVDGDGRVCPSDNVELAAIAKRELEANGVDLELDSHGVFDRLGMRLIRDDLMTRHLSSPLGRFDDERAVA